MKKFLTLAVVAMMALTANAQIVSSRSSSITRTAGNLGDYNRIGIAYTPTSIGGDLVDALKKENDATCSKSGFGFTAEYVHGFNLTNGNKPLYLEVGGGLKYFHAGAKGDIDDGDDYSYETKFNGWTLCAPVNITYQFQVGPDFTIAPYAGFHINFNLIGKVKHETTEIWGNSSYLETYDINLFDDEFECSFVETWRGQTDTGSETDDMSELFESDTYNKASRIQFGYQLGCGVNYKQCYAKLGYSAELTPYISTPYCDVKRKATTGGLVIGLGYTF